MREGKHILRTQYFKFFINEAARWCAHVVLLATFIVMAGQGLGHEGSVLTTHNRRSQIFCKHNTSRAHHHRNIEKRGTGECCAFDVSRRALALALPSNVSCNTSLHQVLQPLKQHPWSAFGRSKGCQHLGTRYETPQGPHYPGHGEPCQNLRTA